MSCLEEESRKLVNFAKEKACMKWEEVEEEVKKLCLDIAKSRILEPIIELCSLTITSISKRRREEMANRVVLALLELVVIYAAILYNLVRRDIEEGASGELIEKQLESVKEACERFPRSILPVIFDRYLKGFKEWRKIVERIEKVKGQIYA